MPKVPMAVIAALDDEIRIIRSKMSVDSRIHVKPGLITAGIYLQKPIILVRTGIGRRAMRSTISHLLEGHRPEMVIHIGYCGGAVPALASGDLVVADRVVDSRDGRCIECEGSMVARAREVIQGKSMRGQVGGLVTVDEVAASPHEKAFLATEYDAVGIDMESIELADVVSSSAIPFIVIRSVLDPLDYHVPDLWDAMDRDGSTDGFALAEHLLKKPSDFLKLPKLQYLASQARNSITAFIDAWMEEA